MFERAKQLLDGVLVAEVDQVAAALRLMAERNRIIAEGAGATPVACVLDRPKSKIVCVVSGGNIDLSKLAEIFGTN
jgi:threonine dehydratase